MLHIEFFRCIPNAFTSSFFYYKMSTTYVSLVIHHAGKFKKEKGMKYVGGKVQIVEDMLDIDRLSYPAVNCIC